MEMLLTLYYNKTSYESRGAVNNTRWVLATTYMKIK